MLGLGLHITKFSSIDSEVYTPAVDPIAWYNENSVVGVGFFEPISTYVDITGNGFDIEQTDPQKQPIAYPISTSLGQALVPQFTNDSIINGALPVLNGFEDFTIIYAGGNLHNYHTAIYIGDDDTPDNTSSFRLGRSSNGNYLRGVVGDNANGAFDTGFAFRMAGFRDIVYAYRKGYDPQVSATDSSDIYLGLDNGSTVNEVQFGISGLDLSFGDGIGIGTNNPDNPSLTGTGNNWTMFEMLIYNRGLSEEELNSTRLYLRKKWKV